MPIDVVCEECGHELAVSGEMAGRKGRCPECDGVISIPGDEARAPRGGAFTPIPRERPAAPSGGLVAMANLVTVLAVASLLLCAYVGVYTGVTAFKGAESFHGAFGLFSDCQAAVEANSTLMGVAFCLGGLLAGFLSFVILLATAQAVRMFLSLERSLREIAWQLTDAPRD
ncbi:MAG: hypothetical protein ABFS86_03670 [Planctomycetota bacterium]